MLNPNDTTVVLLAAGHGKRMLPLTEHTPKPLLEVAGQTLIERHLLRLKTIGVKHVVINIAHLGEQISSRLGDGSRYGLTIDYSDETSSGPLETAGGLKKALSLIKSDPFLAINADIWTDFDYAEILTPLKGSGRLMMVNNPKHNLDGDFAISCDGFLNTSDQEKLTYSGVALYSKSIFDPLTDGKAALAPIFRQLIAKRALEGLSYSGRWTDVGTPVRLDMLNEELEDI